VWCRTQMGSRLLMLGMASRLHDGELESAALIGAALPRRCCFG
jgi:hypothetical protein